MPPENDIENNNLLSWTTKEHVHLERSIDFYWVLGLITLTAAVLAFILRDGLFGALILIGGGMYGYISWVKPKDITVVITDKEIIIEDDIYNISKILAFRVTDLKGDKELLLKINRPYQSMVSACVPDDMEVQIKDTLSKMLPVDDTLVPHIGRRFMARYKI